MSPLKLDVMSTPCACLGLALSHNVSKPVTGKFLTIGLGPSSENLDEYLKYLQ